MRAECELNGDPRLCCQNEERAAQPGKVRVKQNAVLLALQGALTGDARLEFLRNS